MGIYIYLCKDNQNDMIYDFKNFKLNEMGKYPIGEGEMGAWYEYGNSTTGEYAHFFPLDSAFYNNVMIKNNIDAIISTFSDFKKVYNKHIGNNLFRKNRSERTYGDYTNENKINYGEYKRI